LEKNGEKNYQQKNNISNEKYSGNYEDVNMINGIEINNSMISIISKNEINQKNLRSKNLFYTYYFIIILFKNI
jgi:hypothetical protein